MYRHTVAPLDDLREVCGNVCICRDPSLCSMVCSPQSTTTCRVWGRNKKKQRDQVTSLSHTLPFFICWSVRPFDWGWGWATALKPSEVPFYFSDSHLCSRQRRSLCHSLSLARPLSREGGARFGWRVDKQQQKQSCVVVLSICSPVFMLSFAVLLSKYPTKPHSAICGGGWLLGYFTFTSPWISKRSFSLNILTVNSSSIVWYRKELF